MLYNRCLGVFRVVIFLTLNLVKSLIICDLLVACVVSSCVCCVPSAVKCYCCTIYQLPMGKYLMV